MIKKINFIHSQDLIYRFQLKKIVAKCVFFIRIMKIYFPCFSNRRTIVRTKLSNEQLWFLVVISHLLFQNRKTKALFIWQLKNVNAPYPVNCKFQVVADGTVTWYESLIMLVLYAGYIVVMRYVIVIQTY